MKENVFRKLLKIAGLEISQEITNLHFVTENVFKDFLINCFPDL